MEQEANLIQEKEKCCGCTACGELCPTHAIHMEPDGEGFLYPVVDHDSCISCGLCRTVCPMAGGAKTVSSGKPQTAAGQAQDFAKKNVFAPIKNRDTQKYAIRHKDSQVRMASTSGAAYTGLSDYVLDRGGVVYATVFDSEWEAGYVRITQKEQRDASRGAKYVQSRLDHTYTLVETDLAEGNLVFFVGPPCYVDGLHRFLEYSAGKKDGVLFTADLVCHGVPSPLLWREQVSFLKRTYAPLWKTYLFRDKRFGWRGVHNTLILAGGEEVSGSKELDAFTSLYFAGLISRPACHACRYTNLCRQGDLTIGDCWGIEECRDEFDDGMGISLVIVNTDAGAKLFEQVKEQFDLIQLKENECVQPQLQKPADPSADRDAFWTLYRNQGYEACIKKYTAYGYQGSFCSKIKQRLFAFFKAR